MSPVQPAVASVVPQVSFKKILVPTDFSECSQTALMVAASIARAHGGEIILAHVIAPEPAMPTPLEPAVWEYERLRKNAEGEINSIARADFLTGIPCAHEVHIGDLWTTLVFVGEKHAADLVVVGTHGRTGLKKIVRGSVAEQIFRLASVPVVTVGPEVKRDLLQPHGLSTVLFATDFSEHANHALPWAVALARQDGAKLVLLHILEGPPAITFELERDITATAQRRLDDLVASDIGANVEHEPVVVTGAPAEGILHVAEQHNADLIVLGVLHSSQAGASARAHLPWATAHQVVAHAKCPVMTVRS